MYIPSKMLIGILTTIFLHILPFAQCQQKVPDNINFPDLPGWLDNRECVRTCFYYCLSGVCTNKVADELGCKTNKCLCSSSTIYNMGLDSSAKCAQSCNTVEDENVAKKVFADYCTFKGYNLGNSGDLTTSTTAPQSSSTQIVLQISSQLSVPSNTYSSTSPQRSSTSIESPNTTSATPDQNKDTSASSDSNKLGLSEIIGIAIGLGSLVVAIVTLWITWKKRKDKRERESRSVL